MCQEDSPEASSPVIFRAMARTPPMLKLLCARFFSPTGTLFDLLSYDLLDQVRDSLAALTHSFFYDESYKAFNSYCAWRYTLEVKIGIVLTVKL
jgi:hypothetical protein